MKPHLSVLTIFLLSSLAVAADGEPFAIRFWEDRSISIESHCGLNLGVLPSSALTNVRVSPHRVDETVHAMMEYDHGLSREPNSNAPVFRPLDDDDASPNTIEVKSEHPRETKLARGLRMHLDGVTIAVAVDLGEQSRALEWDVPPADILVIPPFGEGSQSTLSHPVVISYCKALRPKCVVVSAKSSAKDVDVFTSTLKRFANETKKNDHNTLAVAKASLGEDSAPLLILLADSPAKLAPELEALFQAMEKSNAKSQQIFKRLSAKQLNFRPSNGTHTPRWNTEHMMGRQLLFFSQIYHAIEPAIPVMNLNPKQMPPDYVAAHPDWDGREEARQMQRVSEFTRRFAYLLEGVELDKRAPGSGWTLRALLRQMERHYDDHTANTVKKFELPDWPSE